MRKLSSLVGYRLTQDFVVFKKVAHLVGYHQFVYQKSSANLTHSVYTTSYTQNRAMLCDEQVNEFLRKVNRKKRFKHAKYKQLNTESVQKEEEDRRSKYC